MSELVRQEDFQKKLEQVRMLFPHLKKVSDQEIMKAIAVARHLGLDPVRREVHFVPYGSSLQMIVSYLEYVKRAERSGKLDGWKVNFGKDEIGEYAEITIYRKDWREPFSWKVYMEEAKQNTPTWQKMPRFMLRKVAIAQGFRIAFPEETGMLPYEEAEMPHQTGIVEPEEEEPELVEMATNKQIGAIYSIAKKKGVDVKELIAKEYGVESTKDLTKKQASELIERLQKVEEKKEEKESIDEETKEEFQLEEEEDVPF